MKHADQNKYTIRLLSREEAISIYRDNAPLHFPDDELKPVSTIELLYDMNAYLGLGLYDIHERLLGYALFLTPLGQDTVLLDYYAILEEYRNLGLGSLFLQGMKSHFQDIAGILIETEDPAFAPNEEEALLRNRRNAFYYKNGAQPTGVFCTLFGVPFQIQFMPTRGDSYANTLTENQQTAGVQQTPGSRQNTAAQQVPMPGSLDAFVHSNLEASYRFMLPDSVYEQNVVWR